MTTTLRREYARYRRDGGTAKGSFRCARVLAEWEQFEQAGLVRLRVEPEQESYFDVYGEPEGYEGANGRRVSAEQERKELCAMIERNGLWWVVAEYFNDGEWVSADSIGMIDVAEPTNPHQNDYVPDLMRSALDKVAQCGEH